MTNVPAARRAPPAFPEQQLVERVAQVVNLACTAPPRALVLADALLAQPPLPERLRADVLRSRALAHFQSGDTAQALADVGLALAAAEAVRDSERAARCLSNLGSFEWSLGHYGDALQAHQQALALAARTSEVAGIAFGNIGLVAESLGEHELALHFALSAHAQLPSGQPRAGLALNAGSLLLRLGRLAEARPMLQEAADVGARSGMRTYQFNAQSALAWIDALTGDRAAAQRTLRSVMASADEAGLPLARLRAQMLLGEVQLLDGLAEAAAHTGLACAEALIAMDELALAHGGLGQWLPQALAACGRWREAYEWQQRCQPTARPPGHDPHHATRRALFALAAEPWAGPAAPSAAPQYHAVPAVARRLHLGEIDAQILCAVVAGLRNAEIGRALALSAHTVRNRLSLAMRRLGVDSRTAAARRALELGMVRMDSPGYGPDRGR